MTMPSNSAGPAAGSPDGHTSSMTTEITAPTHPLVADARALMPDLVTIRRRIHRRPEIGLRLPATQGVIAGQLEKLGLTPRLGTSTSSVTAVIEGGRPGPTTLLRADMDALPLQEDTGLDFASEIDGAMHACGHDTHVTMLLGAARLLLDRRAELPGNVLLMFQPGEEGYHGARFMIDEGLLDAAPSRPTGAFAIHIGTRYETGTFNLRPGPAMAGSDRLVITVRGRGGHASSPHLAVDPILASAEIVVALQAMVTRRIDAFDPAIVTIAHVKAGTTNNIIPEEAYLEGTIRTFSEATRTQVHAGIRRVAEGITRAHEASAEVEIEPGYPVTTNDPAYTAAVRTLAVGLVGEDLVRDMPAPIMGAEDFSYVLQQVPGAMVFLGARPAGLDPATAPQNHSNVVVFDEEPMALGVALYAAVALAAGEG